MSLYGVTQEMESDFKQLCEKYKKEHPDNQAIQNLDPDVLGNAELKYGHGIEYSKPTVTDFRETVLRSPLKK